MRVDVTAVQNRRLLSHLGLSIVLGPLAVRHTSLLFQNVGDFFINVPSKLHPSFN
jgi:hypothetical protein